MRLTTQPMCPQDYFREITREDVAKLLSFCIDPEEDEALLVPRLGPSSNTTIEHSKLQRSLQAGRGSLTADAQQQPYQQLRRSGAAAGAAQAGAVPAVPDVCLYDVDGLDDVSNQLVIMMSMPKKFVSTNKERRLGRVSTYCRWWGDESGDMTSFLDQVFKLLGGAA